MVGQHTCPLTLEISSSPIADGTYAAKNLVHTSATIPQGGAVTFNSGQSIELEYGFKILANANFDAHIEPCCDGASITTCNKIIRTIQPNKLGIVDVSYSAAVLDYDGCSANSLSLSFSNTDPAISSFTVDCVDASHPAGLVPGSYTIYSWNQLSNAVIICCTNLLQVIDAAGYCN